MGIKTCFIAIVCVGLCGCNQFGVDPRELQLFRRDVGRLTSTCDKLTSQVKELTKLTAELSQQVTLLQEARKPVMAKPVPAPEPATIMPAESTLTRGPQPTPGLCDIVDTHIAAVEGILSQPDPDAVGTLLDDLAAAFDANLKAFDQHPRIDQIREAASAMRNEFLAAAKQAPLATNPYLKNVRQKSLKDARSAARKLRSLCGE